jgi:serine/threonine protein phosphatase 1
MPKKWVIADVHGCFKTLKVLMEEKICPGPSDTLYFLGDYIDRGPQSKEVIDYIRALQRSSMNVIALMGNHEESMIQSILEARSQQKKWLGLFKKSGFTRNAWYNFGGETTMNSFGLTDPALIPDEYFEWLNGLHNYAIEEKYLLSHAGFNFTIPNIFDDTDAMRWIRDFTVDMKKTNGKKVIHGHVPVQLDLIKESVTNSQFDFIDLDNGCVYKNRMGMGNLIGFELNTSQLVIQPNIE